MNLSKYEVLLKTVELGSLTNAAIHYGYTQSAVSQVIQSLEDELGVVFLLRSRAGLSLTTEGEALSPISGKLYTVSSFLQSVSTNSKVCTGEFCALVHSIHWQRTYCLP